MKFLVILIAGENRAVLPGEFISRMEADAEATKALAAHTVFWDAKASANAVAQRALIVQVMATAEINVSVKDAK